MSIIRVKALISTTLESFTNLESAANNALRLLMGLCLFSLLSACNTPNPTVEKPPNIGSTWVAPISVPLKDYGYMQDEYFFSGTANSYVNSAPLTADGEWSVAPSGETADYKSRMIVYRPTDPAKFNGTVIVGWMNVSAGIDTPTEWIMLHTELMRQGYAYVGVSAQYVGVEGGDMPLPNPAPINICLALKCFAPLRYQSLSHPGDSFSYDIFRQAAQAVRYPEGVNPLGDLQVKHMIAAGQSQSAHRLVTFVDAFGPYLNDLFDGYFIHSRLGPGIPELGGGASAPLSQAPQADVNVPAVVKIRGDLGVPVMNLQTETDQVRFRAYTSRQPDSANYRLWEVAGSAHADLYVSNIGLSDTGDDIAAAEITLTDKPSPLLASCPDNINSAPQHHFTAKAAMSALNSWIVDGIAPPSFPRLQLNTGADGYLTDAYGNALGGVRSPYEDVPTARLSGLNSSTDNGTDICFLYGSTAMLDNSTLQSLYPTHADYVAAVTAAANDAVAKRSLLADDAQLVIEAAEAADIPPQ